MYFHLLPKPSTLQQVLIITPNDGTFIVSTCPQCNATDLSLLPPLQSNQTGMGIRRFFHSLMF